MIEAHTEVTPSLSLCRLRVSLLQDFKVCTPYTGCFVINVVYFKVLLVGIR